MRQKSRIWSRRMLKIARTIAEPEGSELAQAHGVYEPLHETAVAWHLILQSDWYMCWS